MWLIVLKVIAAACLISFVSWLSNKNTALAGFLTALPLTTMIALAFSHMEWGDAEQSVQYAKSILVAVPLSLLFFVPFLLAKKLEWGFWGYYAAGSALLFIGYLIHSGITKQI